MRVDPTVLQIIFRLFSFFVFKSFVSVFVGDIKELIKTCLALKKQNYIQQHAIYCAPTPYNLRIAPLVHKCLNYYYIVCEYNIPRAM